MVESLEFQRLGYGVEQMRTRNGVSGSAVFRKSARSPSGVSSNVNFDFVLTRNLTHRDSRNFEAECRPCASYGTNSMGGISSEGAQVSRGAPRP